MSTRCQITVADQNVKFYHHCDGYPDYILPILVPYVKGFLDKRGWDPEYLIARICFHFIHTEGNQHGYLGYGLDCKWHGDTEYRYIIHENRTIEVIGHRDDPVFIKIDDSIEDSLAHFKNPI